MPGIITLPRLLVCLDGSIVAYFAVDWRSLMQILVNKCLVKEAYFWLPLSVTLVSI